MALTENTKSNLRGLVNMMRGKCPPEAWKPEYVRQGAISQLENGTLSGLIREAARECVVKEAESIEFLSSIM